MKKTRLFNFRIYIADRRATSCSWEHLFAQLCSTISPLLLRSPLRVADRIDYSRKRTEPLPTEAIGSGAQRAAGGPRPPRDKLQARGARPPEQTNI